jgi:type IV pilus assembly protein PilY1
MLNARWKLFSAAAALLVYSQAHAFTVTDDFRNAVDTNDWRALGFACLTAGTSSNNNSSISNIPGCNLSSPDTVGQGALRLTPAAKAQHGAIVSNYTFPSSQGLDVTFTTYSYGGKPYSPYGPAAADGISFFLMDGSVGTRVGGQDNLGSWGGSLAYSCSNANTPYNGLTGAYLGLGIDEWGNFLNNVDNTATGVAAVTSGPSSNGYNSYAWPGIPQQQSNRIGLRGAGNVSWYWLNQTYPALYPSSLSSSVQASAVQSTCETGTLWDYAGATSQPINGNPTVSGTTMTVTVSSVVGYQNGDSVKISGLTPPGQPLVGPAGGFSKYKSTSTSCGWSCTKTTYTAQVNIAGSTSGFSAGQTVVISGATGSGSGYGNGTFNISSIVSSSALVITLPGAGDPTSSNTGSAMIAAGSPNVNGTYTISNVNLANNTFTVNLSGSVSGVTNVSGAVVNNSLPSSGRDTGVAVADYAPITGGYWILPDSQLLANVNTATRSGAWPVTYKLKLSPGGMLTFLYSYNGGAFQQVLSNYPITLNNGPLPATYRFGFAGSTGGYYNIHEITCFLAQPTQSSAGAGANTVQAGQVKTGTQVYLASYNTASWTGTLVSDPLVNTGGTLSVSTVAEWDASCVLTGGPCYNMGSTNGVANNSITVESPSSRQLLTWSGSAGIPLEWTSLTSSQQSVLNSSDSNGAIRLNWLRGDRTQETLATPAGPLRARDGVLGDIVDSSPTWVGPPPMNYGSQIFDSLYSTAGTESPYATFANSLETRLNIVYVGGNDGFLHGFRSGANNADGTYNGTLNDGKEVIGFMPSTALANSNIVSLTSTSYMHNYFADATPGYGDLYFNGVWHSWLVSGIGPGGQEIFVLDVTDPTGSVVSGAAFSESNASNVVVHDWTNSTLTTCVHASTNCGANLGYSYGTPLVRRLHNGQWAIIFGNGLGSANGVAGIYIGLVNPSTGAITFYWLSTGTGSTTNPDGIAYVSSADLDGDHVVDYLYAGDLLGNVWRFDLTSSNPADWAASTYGHGSPAPLFTTGFSGNPQPITTKIAVSATLAGGATRVMLGFGTGQAIPFTGSSSESYAPGTQTVYGIWDWNMNKWNNGTTTANSVTIPGGSVKYASLAEVTSSPYRTFTRSNLLADSVSLSTGATRQVDVTKVCWQGGTGCTGSGNNNGNGIGLNNQYGWYFDLPDTNEQVIYNPAFTGGEMLVNTTVPPVAATVGQCVPIWPTGWSMAFEMASGGGSAQNIFPDASGSLVVTNGSSINGVKQNAVGTPYIVSIGSKQYAVNQTAGGDPTVSQINPQGGVSVKRLSWEQLR